MAVFKCKMCGGNLNVKEGTKIIECEFCGSVQTAPNCDDEKKVNLFNRANKLRFSCEFDRAAGIYESIVSEYPNEAEAYWGLCLCKFGIEYVDDPKTAKKIPTCHRTDYKSIFDCEDYLKVVENADVESRELYVSEAKAIDALQQEILDIAKKEKPFDVFICYKETDESGNRTEDSVIAQEVYDSLTKSGLKVFFSRLTLEDKLGQEYEPYIFSALNSAKVMLVIGTSVSNFEAIWVKNEWSRFLNIIAEDKTKKLIPCYKDMDPYDMPNEFSKLQSQDMSKLGFVQDVTRGVQKIINPNSVEVNIGTDATVDSLLDQVEKYLEEKEWNKANALCEQALAKNPECAKAYAYRLLSTQKAKNLDDLKRSKESFSQKDDYKRAVSFADDDLLHTLKEANTENAKFRIKRIVKILLIITLVFVLLILTVTTFIPSIKYAKAKSLMKSEKYEEAISIFSDLNEDEDYKDCRAQIDICLEGIKGLKYKNAMSLIEEKKYSDAVSILAEIDGYGDSHEQLEKIKPIYYKEILSNAIVGSTIVVGQTNIEWIILEKEDNKVLLLSKNSVNRMPYQNDSEDEYNREDVEATWETCSLRSWLNSDFLNEAFSEAEQSMIQTTKVVASPYEENYEWSDAGNDTNDKIFILSREEVKKYLPTEESRIISGEAMGDTNWWLRNTGSSNGAALYVDHNGKFHDNSMGTGGYDITCSNLVRAAVWFTY